jgi:hypothetical protein
MEDKKDFYDDTQDETPVGMPIVQGTPIESDNYLEIAKNQIEDMMANENDPTLGEEEFNISKAPENPNDEQNFFRYITEPVANGCANSPGRVNIYESDQQLINRICLTIFYFVMMYGASSYADLVNKLKTTAMEIKIIYKVTKVAFRRTMKLLDNIKMSDDVFKKWTINNITNEIIAELFLEQMKDVLKSIKKADLKMGGPEGLASSFEPGVLKQVLSLVEAYNFNFTSVLDTYSPFFKIYVTDQFETYKLKDLIFNNNIRKDCRDELDIAKASQYGYSHWAFLPFKLWYNEEIKNYSKTINKMAYKKGNAFFKFKSRTFDKAYTLSNEVKSKRQNFLGRFANVFGSTKKRAQVAPEALGGKKYTRKCKKKRKTKKRKIKKNKKTKKN